MNTITASGPTLSRSPSDSLNLADMYSLSSTNNILFQSNTSLQATANSIQMLYQLNIATKMSSSATLSASSSIVNQIHRFRVIPQIYSVSFVALSKSVKTFDELDQQYTPQEFLHQMDALMICTMGDQPFDHVA